ncbi:MAG: insulinase family protein, partial [Candidatus Krumholzibacteria bacterium]|nr:insulinase family protein [Candidatus Krumholzibacteria bacterium]
MKISSVVFGRSIAFLAILIVAVVLICPPAQAGDIVDHPDKLKFKDLNYKPPKAKDYKHTLECGATAYVAENKEVPTLQVTVMVRAGSMYEPVDKAGLADMTGYLMRNGGVDGMTA